MSVIDMNRLNANDDVIDFCIQFVREMPEKFCEAQIEPLGHYFSTFCATIQSDNYKREGLRKIIYYYRILGGDENRFPGSNGNLFGANIIADTHRYYLYGNRSNAEEIGERVARCCGYIQDVAEACLYSALSDCPWTETYARARAKEYRLGNHINIKGDSNMVAGHDLFDF